MNRRLRPWLTAAVVVASVHGWAHAAPASAGVSTDLNNWDLNETVSTWGGGTQFHISSSSDGYVFYRWLDFPNKTTVISGNTCSDYALLGSTATIGINDADYHQLFRGGAYQCFVLRGRTAIGSGGMYNHDGRVNR